jgi:hypothetical protein
MKENNEGLNRKIQKKKRLKKEQLKEWESKLDKKTNEIEWC